LDENKLSCDNVSSEILEEINEILKDSSSNNVLKEGVCNAMRNRTSTFGSKRLMKKSLT
jgi:hypothetical protein